jgi:hypothetical protein
MTQVHRCSWNHHHQHHQGQGLRSYNRLDLVPQFCTWGHRTGRTLHLSSRPVVKIGRTLHLISRPEVKTGRTLHLNSRSEVKTGRTLHLTSRPVVKTGRILHLSSGLLINLLPFAQRTSFLMFTVPERSDWVLLLCSLSSTVLL